MPTLFQEKNREERGKLFLYGCLPVRFIVYCIVAVLLILFPKITGISLTVISILAIIFVSYQSFKSPSWWVRWPHIIIWVLVGLIGILSYFYPKVKYAIVPVLFIDWITAIVMYNMRFR